MKLTATARNVLLQYCIGSKEVKVTTFDEFSNLAAIIGRRALTYVLTFIAIRKKSGFLRRFRDY